MFDLTAIESALSGTVFAGKLHFARVTESTNSDAMAGGRRGEPHGSVWFAEEQTAGRGRGDHRWHSSASDGLYVSVLLRPQFPAARLPLLPFAAGLAAADAIRSTAHLSVDLRWPNDLLIGPRKAGGILVESASGFAAVGIGINVHQRELPEGLDTPSTSLDLEARVPGAVSPRTAFRPRGEGDGSLLPERKAQKRISRQSLLVALLNALDRETTALANPSAAARIPARVVYASTWITGRRVDVHGPQACSGTTAGLDEHGFLRVETPSGVVIVQTGGIRAAAASSSTME